MNVERLFLALRCETRESVSIMRDNQDAESIMSALKLNFGNKKLLAAKIVAEIKSLPDIDSGKIKLT